MQNYNSKLKNDLQNRCYKFGLNVIRLIESSGQDKGHSKVIFNQLIRSATSVGANLIEARASSSRLEFKRFNEISLKSANETKYWLNLLRDSGISNSEVTNNLINEVSEIANMLASGILRLKNKKF